MLKSLRLTVIPQTYAVCRLTPGEPLPPPPEQADLWAAVRTADELSLVLPEAGVDPAWRTETGWRALKVIGPLDFSLTGILADLSTILANAGLSIFAISTFDTDYILVRQDKLGRAVEALRAAGHAVCGTVDAG
ncbi:MAG: ACT domain-containing protein [Acidobacteriota bacterium]|nr:ACT domain-containing protein [Acidobacteriota bacterium]